MVIILKGIRDASEYVEGIHECESEHEHTQSDFRVIEHTVENTLVHNFFFRLRKQNTNEIPVRTKYEFLNSFSDEFGYLK